MSKPINVAVEAKTGKKGGRLTVTPIGQGVSIVIKLDRQLTDAGVDFITDFLSTNAINNLSGILTGLMDGTDEGADA